MLIVILCSRDAILEARFFRFRFCNNIKGIRNGEKQLTILNRETKQSSGHNPELTEAKLHILCTALMFYTHLATLNYVKNWM